MFSRIRTSSQDAMVVKEPCSIHSLSFRGSITTNLDDMHHIPPSMLYTILPSMLQSRLPTLASFRRTVMDFPGRGDHARSQSTDTSQSRPATPPPLYASRRQSISSSIVSSELEGCGTCSTTSEFERPSPATLRPLTPPEARTGIDWKYSNKGMQEL